MDDPPQVVCRYPAGVIRIARLLPLLTVLAWAITLVVPVLDSGDGAGPRIVVTSLGDSPFDLNDLEPAFIMAWLGVVVCAGLAWVPRRLLWWSVISMAIALALTGMVITMLLDPPFALWDGVDAQGRPTGGMTTAEPTVGLLAWGLGIAALAAASVCGFISSRQPETADRD